MIAKNSTMLNAAVLAITVSGNVFAAEWSETVTNARQAVVTIRIDQVRAFDDEWNKSSEATGFVVDVERGLILTNRHVVTPGPVNARAEFDTGEEVVLTALYRDPVHDFGFFQYDPETLDFTTPRALELAPSRARVGLDIRIVGNDAGERFQVLSGTISRLDRNAPEYKTIGYNDFNTFYIQAATGSSGGSSGSPVLDVEGNVVALNAGAGTRAQSSFFLPLDRVQHALKRVQQAQHPARGTLLSTLTYTPFADLEHLGLPASELVATREFDPDAIGMMQVTKVMPGSAASEKLRVGDILLEVNGVRMTHFAELEQVLDAKVDESIDVVVHRAGERVGVSVPVADLHQVTPASLLELGNAVLHTLSYQLARGVDKPAHGVLVASPGFTLSRAGLDKGAVLTEIDGQELTTLESFVDYIEGLPNGADIRLRYYNLENPGQPRFTVVKLDRRWLATRYCARPVIGDWDCRDLAEPPPASAIAAESLDFGPYAEPPLRAIAPELVNVIFEPPVGLIGLDESIRRGVGLVVDWAEGLIAVDRRLAPHGVGRVSVIFDGRLELDASVVYVHPLHAVSIIRFDPRGIDHPIERTLTWREAPIQTGERAWLVDRDNAYRATASVTELGPQRLVEEGASGSLAFRETNLEAISLPPVVSTQGVIVDGEYGVIGLVTATEGSPARYIVPAWLIRESAERYLSGAPTPSLEVELAPLPLANARRLGLSDEWIDRLASRESGNPQSLVILQTMPGGPLGDVAKTGDLLLAINGAVVSSFRDVEGALSTTAATLTIWRGDAATEVTVDPQALSGLARAHYVTWAGALFHEPHRAGIFAGVRADAPYVPFYYYGSPASRAGLRPLNSIIAMDDREVSNLAELIETIESLDPGQWVRLRIRGWRGDEQVIAVQNDPTYWPGLEVQSVPEADGTKVVRRSVGAGG